MSKLSLLKRPPEASRELHTSTQHDRDSRHTLAGTHSQWGESGPQCLGFHRVGGLAAEGSGVPTGSCWQPAYIIA